MNREKIIQAFVPGHAICSRLKAIRREVAIKMGVELNIPECNNINPCAGSCPQCEKEIQQLENVNSNLPTDFIAGVGKPVCDGFDPTGLPVFRGDNFDRLYNQYYKAPFFGIKRHSINIDGDGVCTLALFHGCNLQCRYCINPQSLDPKTKVLNLSPKELLDIVKADNIYFVATGGGVTFGGGEPLLYPEFINEFRKICPPQWRINVQTSFNVKNNIVASLINSVDNFIVDVKDTHPDIYRPYTNFDNEDVYKNLVYIAQLGLQDKLTVKVPLIEGYNNQSDVDKSVKWLRDNGFNNIVCFKYKTPPQPYNHIQLGGVPAYNGEDDGLPL